MEGNISTSSQIERFLPIWRPSDSDRSYENQPIISHSNSMIVIDFVQGLDPTKQKEVDEKMFSVDGTDNKGKLGANAILAVSLAVAKVQFKYNNFWIHGNDNNSFWILWDSAVTFLP